jgi:hypothetical protein
VSIIDTLITDRTGGYYNATDLNRVGGAVQYLADLLASHGYAVSVSPKTDWAIADIPTPAQMAAYLADVEAIKDKFYGTAPLPGAMDDLTAEGANNIERLLLEVEDAIRRMAATIDLGWTMGIAPTGLFGGI